MVSIVVAAIPIAFGLGLATSRIARAESLGSPDQHQDPASEVSPAAEPVPPAAPVRAAEPASASEPIFAGEPPPSLETTDGTVSAPLVLDRPRFEMAVGLGASFDSTGLVDGRTVGIPAFEVLGGIGQSWVGFEARLLSNEAAGRYHALSNGVADMAIDRLAVDLMVALRPFASYGRGSADRYGLRVLRSFTLAVGEATERASSGGPPLYRLGAVVGGHLDVPLTPARQASELRLRLSARRMFGDRGTLGSQSVSDTKAEVMAGVAVVF
jgi:hypothetical protein